MRQHFDVKVLPRIGPPELGGIESGKHLNCTICWSPRGFYWIPDQKHADKVVELTGLKADSKPAPPPASKATGANARDADDELVGDEASNFRTCCGTALYLAQDMPSIVYAVNDAASGMSQPKRLDWMKMCRIGRYLQGHGVDIWEFRYQAKPDKLLEYSDTDWATCKVTRKSVTCTAARYGDHLLEMTSARQSVVALSSGEAEFYGIVKGAAHGIQLKQVIEICMSTETQLVSLSDSSAARGMCQRTGSG